MSSISVLALPGGKVLGGSAQKREDGAIVSCKSPAFQKH